MDWFNIDLTSDYERNKPVLDSYDVDTLLLEIACNVREINADTVRAQYLESLKSKYETAIEIFEKNLPAIVQHAKNERAKN